MTDQATAPNVPHVQYARTKTHLYRRIGILKQRAEDAEQRLAEAEAHLWALVIWFGGRYEHSHMDRDVQAAARYVNRHLGAEDMTTRHRAAMAAEAEGADQP